MVTNTASALGQGEICIHVELLFFFVFFFHDLNLFILVTIKGQTNSKWFFEAEVSSKTRMNKFDFTYTVQSWFSDIFGLSEKSH